MMTRVIDDVVLEFRCCGCGACAGVCPKRAVSMRHNAAGFLVAVVDQDGCIGCGACMKACPRGADGAWRRTESIPDTATAVIGHAADGTIRARGQSGGFVTAVLENLFRAGEIDGAVVSRWNSETSHAEAVFVSSAEDVVRASGSVYCQTAVVERALEHADHRLAVVALGCQAQALRKLAETGKFAYQPLLIGLVCGGNYAASYVDDLARRAGVDPARVTAFRFRDKTRTGWPGEVSVTADGRTVYLPAKARMALKDLYRAPVCYACADKMCSSADLVVGDPWGVASAGDAGESVALLRTPRGAFAVRSATEVGALVVRDIPPVEAFAGQKLETWARRCEKVAFRRKWEFSKLLAAKTNPHGVELLRTSSDGFAPAKTGGADVLAYGLPLDANFGGPSVVMGIRSALNGIFPGHRLTVYQQRKVDPVSVADMDFPVREFPYRKKMFKFYRDWLLLKLFGRRSKSAVCARFWDDYRAADAVVNLYPICFCAKLKTHLTVKTRWEAVTALFREFGPNLLARLDGKVSVKSTASYGPFLSCGNSLLARLSFRWAFTRALVRERECLEELHAAVGRRCRLQLAPDLANLWHPDVGPVRDDLLGVSVSYQSEAQWRADGEDYVTFMQALIRHVRAAYGCKIILIPNQFKPNSDRSDDVVAKRILAGFGDGSRIEIFDAARTPPGELRRTIGRCAAMVTCRYHSCVAGFASGVPQLILGWHCKYRELAARYGQERRVVQTDGLRLERAIELFDELWRTRGIVRTEIATRSESVRTAVVESAAWLFADLLPKVTVVLPVYNVAQYLRQALESISAQTLKEIEIIAVDDGSTDGSGAILDEYAKTEPRLKVVHIPNGGAGAARNVGLERARGEYLFFCDPDDSCSPEMLADMYRKAVGTNADIVIAGKMIVNVGDGGEQIVRQPLSKNVLRRPQPFSPQDVAGCIFSMAKAVPWDKLFRRGFVERLDLKFQSTRRSNDVFFVDMALASAERIATLPGCYYRYLRRRQGSLTFVKDRFPFAALEAYGAVEEALRARGLWHAFARNFIEVFVARMLADLKSLREDENLKSAYPRVRERFRVFASEGRLDENLTLRPRERRLLDLVLAADSPERLREVFARERAEKKGNRK